MSTRRRVTTVIISPSFEDGQSVNPKKRKYEDAINGVQHKAKRAKKPRRRAAQRLDLLAEMKQYKCHTSDFSDLTKAVQHLMDAVMAEQLRLHYVPYSVVPFIRVIMYTTATPAAPMAVGGAMHFETNLSIDSVRRVWMHNTEGDFDPTFAMMYQTLKPVSDYDGLRQSIDANGHVETIQV